jgi:GntR family transcriptional regulator/MocR family aminotransferase
LAAELRVSRGVVTEAYQRLNEDGHLIGHGRGGTVVVATPVAAAVIATPSVPARPPAALLGATPGEDVFDAMRAAPARIDLTPGVPDLAAFPRTAWLRAERSVLADLSPSAFGYGDPGRPRCGSPSRAGWPATAGSGWIPARWSWSRASRRR